MQSKNKEFEKLNVIHWFDATRSLSVSMIRQKNTRPIFTQFVGEAVRAYGRSEADLTKQNWFTLVLVEAFALRGISWLHKN